jgi:hypothetical protein
MEVKVLAVGTAKSAFLESSLSVEQEKKNSAKKQAKLVLIIVIILNLSILQIKDINNMLKMK